MKSRRKPADYLVEGPVRSSHIARWLDKHKSHADLGAHVLFIGQVRADRAGESAVAAIEYSTYEDMAIESFREIESSAAKKFGLHCIHLLHSVGRVEAGEASLAVMVSAPRREGIFAALEKVVEDIKARVPVWKKEIMQDGATRWVEPGGRKRKGIRKNIPL